MAKEISLIGLGAMGSALARALLSNGYHVTVWNRSAEKAAPLVQEGAILAASAAAAVSASPIVIINVTNYSTSHEILRTTDVSGKLLIELSTGTPKEARDAGIWAKAQGAEYIDGAIMATPEQMGRPDTPLFASGPEQSFKKAEPALKTLAGSLQFMGEEVGAAAAWDLGCLAVVFGTMIGFLQGAKVFQTEGIPVAALGSMIAAIAPFIGEMVKHEGDVIESGIYDNNPQSNLQMASITGVLLKKHAEEAGINAEIPTFLKGLFDRAIAAGYGKEQVAALFKVLN